MKAIKHILGTLLIVMLAGQVMAGGKSKKTQEAELAKKVNLELKEYISYPDFARELSLEGVVMVKYSVDENNSIKVLDTNSNDSRLSTYVSKKLNGHPSVFETGTEHYLKFQFKLIE